MRTGGGGACAGSLFNRAGAERIRRRGGSRRARNAEDGPSPRRRPLRRVRAAGADGQGSGEEVDFARRGEREAYHPRPDDVHAATRSIAALRSDGGPLPSSPLHLRAPTMLCRLVAGALLGFVLGSAPAQAQLDRGALGPRRDRAAGGDRDADGDAHERRERAAHVLRHLRPPVTAEWSGAPRLAQAGSAPCGEYGEVLYRFDEDDFGDGGGTPLASR